MVALADVRRWAAIAWVILLLLLPDGARAGAFIFAGESNGVDLITHPTTYTGTGGVISVTVCIDPASPNVDVM